MIIKFANTLLKYYQRVFDVPKQLESCKIYLRAMGSRESQWLWVNDTRERISWEMKGGKDQAGVVSKAPVT